MLENIINSGQIVSTDLDKTKTQAPSQVAGGYVSPKAEPEEPSPSVLFLP